MDVERLKYERDLLKLGLKRWDDLLSPKERETHQVRNHIAQEIARYEEMIREVESSAQSAAA
ncbi:MAG: hypothetical protein ACE14L_00755 [Terriglobales bacterium]